MLPASGPISLSQINTELGVSSTASISLNDTNVRKLGGKPTSGSAIILPSDFYSKAFIFSPLSLSTTYINQSDEGELSYVSITYAWYSNGFIQCGYQTSSSGGFITSATGAWAGLSDGVGNGYWMRFTRTLNSGHGNYASTASSGWLQLNTTRAVNLFCAAQSSGMAGINGDVTTEYTVEIASDSAGTNIVSTTTGLGGTGFAQWSAGLI